MFHYGLRAASTGSKRDGAGIYWNLLEHLRKLENPMRMLAGEMRFPGKLRE